MRYTYLSDGTKAVKPSEDSQLIPDFPIIPIVQRVQDNNYRFAGKEEYVFGNGDSSLLDFGARYYDPWSCQWTAVDPLAEKYCGIGLYGYCAGNPVNLVDPTGMNWYSYHGKYIWIDSTDNTYMDDDGNIWSNVGTTVSLDLGNGKFQNWFENVGFEASRKFNAEEYILSHGLAGEYLSSGSDLCEAGKQELFNDFINSGRQAFLNHPLTRATLIGLGALALSGIVHSCWVSDNRFLEDIYRVYGDDSTLTGYSWTPSDPRTITNYRQAAGLPNVNSGEFMAKGKVYPYNINNSRMALPLNGNPGGGVVEYIVDPKNVKFIYTKILSPKL